MEIQVTQENLVRALTNVGRVAGSRANLEILHNILLRTDNNRLFVAATNLEIAATQYVGAKVVKPGSFTVPAKLISELVATLPKDTITLKVDKTTLLISAGKNKTTINGVSDEEFPELPIPVTASASGQIGSISSSLNKLSSLAFSSILPSAHAANDFNEARFSLCNDSGYEELGIDADIACNVRYALSPTELNMDTDEVYAWMYANKYVDEDGEPNGENKNYASWLEECTNRGNDSMGGWGDIAEEGGSDGSACLDKFAGKGYSLSELQHFRVFTMDRSIEDGMDNGPESGDGTVDPITGTQLSDDIAALAKIILDNSGSGKTFTINDVSDNRASDVASRSLVSLQLEDMAAGQSPHLSTRCGISLPATITPDVNMMKFLADIAQNSGVKGIEINSLFGQCHSPTSYHYQGKAVDLGCNVTNSAVIQKLDQIGRNYGVSRNYETCAANQHWHYSIGGK